MSITTVCPKMSGTARQVLLLVLIQGTINSTVFATNKDSQFSQSAFFSATENKRLPGHVVARFQSASLLSRGHICMRNAWCSSTNFKASSNNDNSGTCEMNKHSFASVHENVNLHEEKAATFSVFLKLQTPCQSNPCQNHGLCVPDLAQSNQHCVCKPGFAGTLCQGCKFDFEDGIDGWEKTGTVFNNQPTYGDNPTARNRGQPANQQGYWWIGGYENRPSEEAPPGVIQGDEPQGTLTTPSFKIIGSNITFRIGGGCEMKSTRAELIINGQVVRNKTGDCNEAMIRNSWDVQDFIGQSAQVKLVDLSSNGWGHINFDDLGGDISCEQDRL